MSTNFSNHVSSKRLVSRPARTTQMSPLPGRPDMAKNNNGGYTFQTTLFDQLLRFLILGTEGGTYYASEKAHTIQAFSNLKECIAHNAQAVVNMAVEVSQAGRAANNDYALFTLASVMAFAPTPEDKHYARTHLPLIARTGTHLLHFAEFINQLKGWGTGTRKAFQQWYLEKTPEEIAFQYVKYGQRDGWSQRDILRKAHPWGTEGQNAVFKLIVNPTSGAEGGAYPEIIWAAHQAKLVKTSGEWVNLIKRFNLPREALPTEALNYTQVWEALLEKMKPEAIMRNLGKLSSLGMLGQFTPNAKFVIDVLSNPDLMKKARIHPVKVFNAFKTYKNGHGVKGSLSWTPNTNIVSALEGAFYSSFDFQEPSGKNIFIGLDCSTSMTFPNHKVAGTDISAREAAAIMAMVTVKKEPNHFVGGFRTQFEPLNITPTQSLAEVLHTIEKGGFGGTNCSAPMQYAIQKGIKGVDCFQVYTDNETAYAGDHPVEALKKYRTYNNKPNAKLAVVAVSATKFSIADPHDMNMLDFVGFDLEAPQAMAYFAKS